MMLRRFASVSVLLAVAGLAAAQDRPPPSFESLDANKDGRISVSEARKDPRVAARFAAADTNQDGYLDRAEFSALSR